MSSLDRKLASALDSRDRRLIRRRLPDPPLPDEIDFTSNDYLSLASSPTLRKTVLDALDAAPKILGSGGSRLLVPSQPHAELEARLCRFFGADAALLFNSGFDANVGFFSAVPQPGDVVLYDAHIHASVHDGMRLSRVAPEARLSFAHNSVPELRRILSGIVGDRSDLKKGTSSVFVAVESLYSMDGTIAPLTPIVECIEELLPLGNGYVIVDEAHATGIYGPKGRGLVVNLGLEKRVFARLHTFGKALAASGAAILTTELVKDYLINYARSLVFTTTLPFANIVAINCSFDLLEDGTAEALSAHLLSLSTYFVDLLRSALKKYPSSILSIPDHLAPSISDQAPEPAPRQSGPALPWEIDLHDEQSPQKAPQMRHEKIPEVLLPTPIIPILTSEPRELSSFLRSFAVCPSVPPDAPYAPPEGVSLHTKPIYPPTVPQGTARVRICLHAGHTREDVGLLARGILAWAETRAAEERRGAERWRALARDAGVEAWMACKL